MGTVDTYEYVVGVCGSLLRTGSYRYRTRNATGSFRLS